MIRTSLFDCFSGFTGSLGFSNCFLAISIKFSASAIGISIFSHWMWSLFPSMALSFCSIKSDNFSKDLK